MQHFLPSSYSFNTNKLVHFNDYHDDILRSNFENYFVIFFLALLIAVCVCIAFICVDYCISDRRYLQKHPSEGVSALGWGLVCLCIIVQFSNTISTCMNDDHKDIYALQDFKYPITNSNFVVRWWNSYPTSKITDVPKHVSDHKKYPYKLYVKQANLQKRYLGTMKNGNFEPAKTYTAGLFYKYVQYIQNHHLEKKFKRNVYFVQSGKYLNGKNIQWILTNKRDIVLHLNDDAIVKESRIAVN